MFEWTEIGSPRLQITGHSNSVMSCDDISIDQFFRSPSPFLPLTQHVITHISSRVAITEQRFIIITKNIQNNGQITVIVGSSHSDVFRKKSRKTANAHAKEIILVKIWIIIKFFWKLNYSKYSCHGLQSMLSSI